MQENLFYVDKDILEAQARGEADLLEIPHSSLTIGREIGKGAFGRVFIARAENINQQGSQVVAVKKLKSLYFHAIQISSQKQYSTENALSYRSQNARRPMNWRNSSVKLQQ